MESNHTFSANLSPKQEHVLKLHILYLPLNQFLATVLQSLAFSVLGTVDAVIMGCCCRGACLMLVRVRW